MVKLLQQTFESSSPVPSSLATRYGTGYACIFEMPRCVHVLIQSVLVV